MGMNATAILCYGVEVKFEDVPWGDTPVEDWWREVNGCPEHVRDWYVPLMVKYGSYERIPQEVRSGAVKLVREWDAANPMPV
jgi:hypothetical protein